MKNAAICLLVLAYAAGVWMQKPTAPGPGSKCVAVVVEESAKRTPAAAKIYLPSSVFKAAAAHGVEYHVIDQDATGPDVAEVAWAIEAAKKTAKPALITKRGSRVSLVKMPVTAEALAATLSHL